MIALVVVMLMMVHHHTYHAHWIGDYWLLLFGADKTCSCCVSMIIRLSVNHQLESIAVPARAVRPTVYLRVWPPMWVEVDLDENERKDR